MKMGYSGTKKQRHKGIKYLPIFVGILMLFKPIVAYCANDIAIALQRLLKAYPDYLGSVSPNMLYWKDGTAMVYDDGITKDFDTRLNSPDLEDQMSVPYPKGPAYSMPLSKDFDPGRIRYEPFFKKMYGASPKEVRKKLAVIRWLPKTVNKKIRVSSVNDVHLHLQAVSDELDRLPQKLKAYVSKISGTFRWRNIQGTKRLSLHSFGIAIDINKKYANY